MLTDRATMTRHANWTWTLDERFPSDPSIAVRIIAQVLDALIAQSWDDQAELFGIHLALEEAVMNAIKHGNAGDINKKVHLIAKVAPQQFYIRIADQGSGFNPDTVPDPTLEENLEGTTGRGLKLMKHYMDGVSYSKRGNVVVMEKQRRSDANP